MDTFENRSIIETVKFGFNFLIEKQKIQQLNNHTGMDSFISRTIMMELEKGENLPFYWVETLFLTHMAPFMSKTI